MSDLTHALQEQVKNAVEEKRALRIVGGESKSFYGRDIPGETLRVAQHQGIVSYEPTELVLSARAGTPLSVIEETLAENQQMLPFEPPHYGSGATLGGTLACNFSGPRRAYAGAVRDFVLGTRIINGHGQVLSFGGEVMKNVAGYDVSRLMAGAMGTLGVILEASFKILPCPRKEITLVQTATCDEAKDRMNAWAGKPIPISATSNFDEKLYIRLSGTETAVNAAVKKLGGEILEHDRQFWIDLREHKHDFFQNASPLWRISLPQTAPSFSISGERLIEWGGGLLWLKSEASAKDIFEQAKHLGGHATLFRGRDGTSAVFQPLEPNMLALQREIKLAFDPHGVFNPGKMFPEF